MQKFYFTYGASSEGQPFSGGWTEVEAPNEETACAAFCLVHPSRTPGVMDCDSVYSERDFADTGRELPHGNFGQGCHEVIRLTVDRFLKGGIG